MVFRLLICPICCQDSLNFVASLVIFCLLFVKIKNFVQAPSPSSSDVACRAVLTSAETRQIFVVRRGIEVPAVAGDRLKTLRARMILHLISGS